MAEVLRDQIRFNQGIVTDVSPTNAPEGSCEEHDNFIVARDGSRENRHRLGYTGNTHTTPIGSFTSAPIQNWFVWENASNSGKDLVVKFTYRQEDNFGVTDSSDTIIEFFDAETPSTPIQTLTYADEDTSGSSENSFNSQGPAIVDSWVSHQDKLIVAFRNFREGVAGISYYTPHVRFFTYDPVGNAVSESFYQLDIPATLKIRDFNFSSTGTDYESNPASATRDHIYDLYNAGWDPNDEFAYVTAYGAHPSLSEISSFGVVPSTGAFDPALVRGQKFSNSPAPRGRFFVNPFNPRIDRDANLVNVHTAAGTPFVLPTGGTISQTWIHNNDGAIPGRIASMTSFGGRVFYLCSLDEDDIRIAEFGTSFILFSQIGKDLNSLVTCAPINDPASVEANQALPTDGGYIRLTLPDRPIKIDTYRDGLLIFTTRSVYYLPSNGPAFDPTSAIAGPVLISAATTIAHDDRADNNKYYEAAGGTLIRQRAIVRFIPLNAAQVGSAYFFLSNRGIEIVRPDTNTNRIFVQLLTANKLNSYFSKIAQSDLARAVPIVIPRANAIAWLIADNRVDGSLNTPWLRPSGDYESDVHNSMLILDTNSNIIHTFSFGNGAAQNGVTYYPLFAYLRKPQVGTSYDGEVESRVDTPRLMFAVAPNTSLRTIYWCSFDYSSTAKYKSDYLDSAGNAMQPGSEAQYFPRIRTNEINLGDSTRGKGITRLYALLGRTEDSTEAASDYGTCLVRLAFDTVNWDSSRKYVTSSRQMYRLQYNFPGPSTTAASYADTVLKSQWAPRGKGKSFRLEISGESEKLTKIHNFAYYVKGDDQK